MVSSGLLRRGRQVTPKRRFLQVSHGVTTQKTPFFVLKPGLSTDEHDKDSRLMCPDADPTVLFFKEIGCECIASIIVYHTVGCVTSLDTDRTQRRMVSN
jgi:hypothetical protein